MEEDKGISGWIVLLIIVVAALLLYGYYKSERKKRALDEERQSRLKQQTEEARQLAEQCWQQYVALDALAYVCNLCRKTLCEEGILFYYQRLWGLLSGQWNTGQLAARIDGILANGLHNVLQSRLPMEDGHFVLPADAPRPTMEKDTYLHQIGVTLADISEQTGLRLNAELSRLANDRRKLEEGPNGCYYRRLLADLLPVVCHFCENPSLEELPPEEVIRLGKAFRVEVESVLAAHHVACIPYVGATETQRADWFVRAASSAVGEMPAIVRTTDNAVFYKGVYF